MGLRRSRLRCENGGSRGRRAIAGPRYPRAEAPARFPGRGLHGAAGPTPAAFVYLLFHLLGYLRCRPSSTADYCFPIAVYTRLVAAGQLQMMSSRPSPFTSPVNIWYWDQFVLVSGCGTFTVEKSNVPSPWPRLT